MLTNGKGRQRKTADVRRTEIVAAVIDLIGEVGPEGVTTTAIALRIGVSQTALFKHFTTKDAIWIAATDAIGDRIGPVMAEIVQGSGTPLGRVRALVVAYVELARETPAIASLISHRSLPDGDTGLRERVAGRFDRLRQLMRLLLDQAKAENMLAAELDAQIAADLCISVVQTSLLPRHGARERADPAEAEKLITTLLELLRLTGR